MKLCYYKLTRTLIRHWNEAGIIKNIIIITKTHKASRKNVTLRISTATLIGSQVVDIRNRSHYVSK